VRPLLYIFGLMSDAVELPFLTTTGLNTDIMFAVRPIDADVGSELETGKRVHHPAPKVIDSSARDMRA
jgi:hypothetical protein